ncbi:unnamed protein product [Brassica rapa subsp. narinosa]
MIHMRLLLLCLVMMCSTLLTVANHKEVLRVATGSWTLLRTIYTHLVSLLVAAFVLRPERLITNQSQNCGISFLGFVYFSITLEFPNFCRFIRGEQYSAWCNGLS